MWEAVDAHAGSMEQTTLDTAVDAAALDAAAGRLQRAADERTPCAPVRDLIGATTSRRRTPSSTRQRRTAPARRRAASSAARSASPRRPCSSSSASTSPTSACSSTTWTSRGRRRGPDGPAAAAEGRGRDRLRARADLADGPLDDAQVRAAVDYAVAALEIVDSRIADWDITLRRHRRRQRLQRPLRPRRPSVARSTSSSRSRCAMSMTHRRRGGLHGQRRRLPGRPAHAARLAGPHRPRATATPLRAGQVVLSGALGPDGRRAARRHVSTADDHAASARSPPASRTTAEEAQ